MKNVLRPIAKNWKTIAGILVICLLIGVWYYNRQRAQEVELEFVRPERGELQKTLEVSGNIFAKEHARLRFAAGGKLTYLGAKEGDRVSKYQTLATIDQRSLQKNLQKSLNQYSKERLDWEQTQDNTEDRWIPDAEQRTVQKEQYDLNNTVLDVELTTIAITDTVLRSPIDGIVISQPTSLTGVQLGATDIFEVVNPQSLYFRASIDELDIGQVKHRQPVTIILDAFPDEEISSSIDFISYQSAASSTGNAFFAEMPLLHVSDINRYRIGMSGDVTIVLDEKEDTLSIPLDTTIERDGKVYVNVKTGENSYEEREIQTGMETEDRFEVVSGVTEQDEILLPQ